MRTLMIAVLALGAAAPVPGRQSESLRAAAELTGLTSGMASACNLDAKPVIRAFGKLMDRKHVQGKERTRLVELVSQSHDRGFANQHRLGAMSCQEVKGQVRSTIRRLQRAK